MLEENNNVGDFSMYNTIGFSCVTLWIMICPVSMILCMHQAISGMHDNQNNPDFCPSWILLPSLPTYGSLICMAMLVPLI